jgi:MFS family permease
MEFISSLANSTMFTTYAVYYIATLRLNPFELVILGTVLEVSVLIFEGITGVIADTYGRRRSVITGMFVVGCGFALQGMAPSIEAMVPFLSVFMQLLIAQVIWGVGHTFMSGADTAWIVDEVGEENVGRIFIRTKRFSLIGTLLGIALSVGLSTLAPNLPYLAGGLMLLGLAVFLLFYMKETKFVRPERAAESSHWHNMKATWLSGAKVVRGQPMLLLIFVVTVFSGAASEGYDRLWEAHLMTGIGFPNSIALSMAVWFGLISIVTTFLSLSLCASPRSGWI